MKNVLLIAMCIAVLSPACSKETLPPGMHSFRLDEKMDIEGARVSFKLNKSGDSLFVHIHKPWAGDPEKGVQYEINIYDKDQQLIQSSVHKSKRKYSNISRNFTMIDKSNVGRVAYFSVKISE